MKISIPLSWWRRLRYSPAHDAVMPMRRVFFFNIGRDERIFFSRWGVAITVRFGVGYA
jgi:hypothetical protein